MDVQPCLRIFVSSPGDVDTERKIAARVIKRLQGEFRGRVELEEYFWEDEPMRHQGTFQEQIPSTAEFDLVICILWSRLGTPLVGPDGKQYPSGTHYEVESARAAYEETGKPDLLIYFNQTPAQIRQLPREERERMMRQLEALENFIDCYCVDPDSQTIKGAFSSYQNLGQFEDLLERHVGKLIIGKLSTQPGVDLPLAVPLAPMWQGRPYQGLKTFDYEHAPIFFGRTRATGDVLALLRQRAMHLEEARAAAISGVTAVINPSAGIFVLVCAMSGVGKSSLVRAGVLPLLTQPGNEIGLWRRVVLRPSEMPPDGDLFNALAQELTRPDGLPELLDGVRSREELAFNLRQDNKAIGALLGQALGQAAELVRVAEDVRLAEEIRRCREAGRIYDIERLEAQRASLLPPTARLVVVIDQIEELFTSERITAEMRRGFDESLAALARSGWAWVIGTLRSDFFGRCVELPELMELKRGAGFYDLKPPTKEELGQIIRRPAQSAGLRFERHPSTDAALDEALRDVALLNPEALPLLGFALDELYDHRSDDGMIGWQAYERIGGLEGAIEQRAQEVYSILTEQQRSAFDTVMRGVTTVALEKQGAFNRRWADYSQLAAAHPGARVFIDAFLAPEVRLFLANQTEDGRAVVSVAHEALLSAWPRLREWLQVNRELLIVRAQLGAAVAEWLKEKRSTEYLLVAGLPLAKAKQALANGYLERDEVDFVVASSYKEEETRRRQTRRLKSAVLAFALLTLLAAAGAMFGFLRERQALSQTRIANEQTLIAESARSDAGKAREKTADFFLKSYYSTALSFADQKKKGEALAYFAAALRIDANYDDAVAAIYNLLVQPTPISFPLAQPLRNINTREPFQSNLQKTAKPDESLYLATFSPDGKRVAAATSSSSAPTESFMWILDAFSGKPVTSPGRIPAKLSALAYDPKGKKVLGAGWDGVIYEWSAADGHSMQTTKAHEKGITSLVLNKAGTQFATASMDKTARVWNMENGSPVTPPLAHDAPVNSINFGPDDRMVITTTNVSGAQLWAVEGGVRIGKAIPADGRVLQVFFDPDANLKDWKVGGSDLLVLTITADSAQWWSLVKTEQNDGASQTGNDMGYNSAQFVEVDDEGIKPGTSSHLGTMNATATIIVLCHGYVATVYSQAAANTENFNPPDIKPDAPTAPIVPNLFEPILPPRADYTWSAVGSLETDGDIVDLQFDTSGKFIATSSKDGSCQIWDAATCQPIIGPLKHSATVETARFSFDSSIVLTTSADGKLAIWEVRPPVGMPAPKWLPELAEAIGGYAVNETGGLIPVASSAINLIKSKLAFDKNLPFWSQFGNWVFFNEVTRGISPRFLVAPQSLPTASP